LKGRSGRVRSTLHGTSCRMPPWCFLWRSSLRRTWQRRPPGRVPSTQYAGNAVTRPTHSHAAIRSAIAKSTRACPASPGTAPIASLAGMARSAWFKDRESNIMCIDEHTSEPWSDVRQVGGTCGAHDDRGERSSGLGWPRRRVGEAVDCYRAGELDARPTSTRSFFHRARAARELWVFLATSARSSHAAGNPADTGRVTRRTCV